MLIIGIDPGISGSICFFEDGKILDVVEMPTMTEGKKNKRQVNGSQIYNEISKRIEHCDKTDIKVIIEQVSAMPGQGVTSMFNFGQSFGILKEKEENLIEFFENLEDNEDVQNFFNNAKFINN